MNILNYFSKEKRAQRKQQKLALKVDAYHANISWQVSLFQKCCLKDYHLPLLIMGITEKILFREEAAAFLSKIRSEEISPDKMVLKLMRTDEYDNFSVWTYEDYFIEIGYKSCHYGIFDQRLNIFEPPYLNRDGVTFMSARIWARKRYYNKEIISPLKEYLVQFTLVYNIYGKNFLELLQCNVCGAFDGDISNLPSNKPLVYYKTRRSQPFSWEELVNLCDNELNNRINHAVDYNIENVKMCYHRYLE